MEHSSRQVLITMVGIVAIAAVVLYVVSRHGNTSHTQQPTSVFSGNTRPIAEVFYPVSRNHISPESRMDTTDTVPFSYTVTRYIPRSHSERSSAPTTTDVSTLASVPSSDAYDQNTPPQYLPPSGSRIVPVTDTTSGVYTYGCGAGETYNTTTGMPCNGGYNNTPYYNQYQY